VYWATDLLVLAQDVITKKHWVATVDESKAIKKVLSFVKTLPTVLIKAQVGNILSSQELPAHSQLTCT
jgi:hypothetical protein